MKESARQAGDTGSSPGSGRPPGGGKATHSHILAWEIPWTEEPGRLYPWGHQRVGHNLVTKQQLNNDNSHQLATGSRKQRATPIKWSITEGEC